MVKIKLCGMAREEDVIKAVGLGVDYLGFILYPKSPRFVGWERLGELLELAKGVKRVGVFVNPTLEEVEKAFRMGLDLVQLHGEESYEFAQKVGLGRVIKAFRVRRDKVEIEDVWRGAYAVLLDTYSEDAYGGTGKTFNWDVAKKVVERGFRVFLSGGLTPENVGQAIRHVRPYAVDVSSGIESSPGVKDHKRMEEFVHGTKNAPKG